MKKKATRFIDALHCSEPELDTFISVMAKHLPVLQSRLAAARREKKSRIKKMKVKP